jgi:hypothetical protein
VQKAECIIRGIYKKQKEAFTSVAFEIKRKNGCTTSYGHEFCGRAL